MLRCGEEPGIQDPELEGATAAAAYGGNRKTRTQKGKKAGLPGVRHLIQPISFSLHCASACVNLRDPEKLYVFMGLRLPVWARPSLVFVSCFMTFCKVLAYNFTYE